MHKVLGSLLHGDAAEVQNDLVTAANRADARRFGVKINAVVDHFALGWVHAVTVRADVFGEHAHCDNAHRSVHSAAFDVVDGLVDVLAGTIEFR